MSAWLQFHFQLCCDLNNTEMAVNITSTGFVYKKKQLFDVSKSRPVGRLKKSNYMLTMCRNGLNRSQPQLSSSEFASPVTESNLVDFKANATETTSVNSKENERRKASNFKTFQKGRKWRLFDNPVANGYVDDGTAKTFREKLETFEQYCKKSTKDNRLTKIFQKNPSAVKQNGSNKGDCKTENPLSKWRSLPSFLESDKIDKRPDANSKIETVWHHETRFDIEVKGKSTLKKQNWAVRFSNRLNLIRQKLESHCSVDKNDAMQHLPFGGSNSQLHLEAGKLGNEEETTGEYTVSQDMEDRDINENCSVGKSACSVLPVDQLDGKTTEYSERRTPQTSESDCWDEAGMIKEMTGEELQKICQSICQYNCRCLSKYVKL